MRALLGIVLAVAGLWAGYWWVGSTAVERGAVDWFAAQEAWLPVTVGLRFPAFPTALI
jgi:hypothetical protein